MFGNTVHKEVQVLEDQWRDGQTTVRRKNRPVV